MAARPPCPAQNHYSQCTSKPEQAEPEE
jgi:hypothetical protein